MKADEFLEMVNSIFCGVTGVGIADIIVGATSQIKAFATVLHFHGMLLVSAGLPIVIITAIAQRLLKKEKEVKVEK